MGTAAAPSGKAMYVAPRTDWDWLRSKQCKLYTRSKDNVVIGSLTTLSVTVKDPQGAEETIGAMWESAICEERCVEGEHPDADCPVPWP